jgi:hypothetical protein
MYCDLEDQVRHAVNRVAVYHDASQTLSPPSMPSSRHHITPLAYNASPALLPPSTPSSYQCHMTSPADEELPEYTLTSPSLRLQDVVKKHNLMPYMDDAEQCAQRSKINWECREEVYAGIAAWETYMLSKAEELGECFNKHP